MNFGGQETGQKNDRQRRAGNIRAKVMRVTWRLVAAIIVAGRLTDVPWHSLAQVELKVLNNFRRERPTDMSRAPDISYDTPDARRSTHDASRTREWRDTCSRIARRHRPVWSCRAGQFHAAPHGRIANAENCRRSGCIFSRTWTRDV